MNLLNKINNKSTTMALSNSLYSPAFEIPAEFLLVRFIFASLVNKPRNTRAQRTGEASHTQSRCASLSETANQ
jgi:hypothetical protein